MQAKPRALMPATIKPETETGPDTDAVKPSITKRKNKSTFAIPKGSFRKLVQEIASSYKSDLRFQREAIDALQESSETMLLDRFQRCSALADLCKLDTVRDEHWRFVEQGSTLLG